nr:MAG TPA: hypothetical protein [Caudoviricetes sp.]
MLILDVQTGCRFIRIWRNTEHGFIASSLIIVRL